MTRLTEADLINECVNSKHFCALNENQKASMGILLENTVNELKEHPIFETNSSGDVEKFTPIILPIVRRTYPTLIANEVLGVQAMQTPTGYIYALVNHYTGDGQSTTLSPTKNGLIIETEAHVTVKEGDTVFTDAKVLFAEVRTNYILIERGATPINVGDEIADSKVKNVFTNEASFAHILTEYTGPYSTAAAEKLGKDMREMGFSISRKAIEVKSRALKGQWTVEMFQDLKSQHGLLADMEIQTLLEYEMRAELDREVINFVNANSTQCPDTVFKSLTDATFTDGRWEIERYRAQAVRIAKESAMIGLETKRGQGNILIVSPKVSLMLEQVGTFKPSPVASGVTQPVSGGVAGTFDNKFKVIVDQYATSDYCTVLYKGVGSQDSMGFFAPYIPLSFTRIVHEDSGQPAVIAKMRYGLDTTPGYSDPRSNDRAKAYSRTFGVDFANTVLA